MQDFWAFVPFDDPDESVCTLWMGPTVDGYGQFSNNLGISNRAHRAIWEMEHGEIPEEMCVLHHCDVRLCIRLSHLWLGTNLDNLADMFAKGRGSVQNQNGERHPMARLTEAEVLVIRDLANKGVPHKIIAEKFKITRAHVYQISARIRWWHI
jgi:hypothetical protein